MGREIPAPLAVGVFPVSRHQSTFTVPRSSSTYSLLGKESPSGERAHYLSAFATVHTGATSPWPFFNETRVSDSLQGTSAYYASGVLGDTVTQQHQNPRGTILAQQDEHNIDTPQTCSPFPLHLNSSFTSVHKHLGFPSQRSSDLADNHSTSSPGGVGTAQRHPRLPPGWPWDHTLIRLPSYLLYLLPRSPRRILRYFAPSTLDPPGEATRPDDRTAFSSVYIGCLTRYNGDVAYSGPPRTAHAPDRVS
jgi:hypothetical protein